MSSSTVWPLTGDAFEDQMFFLTSHGYRCIAHDRRGHGRSSRHGTATTWTPTRTISPNSFRSWTSRTRSTSSFHRCGEVARYVARHGTERVAKVVLIGAVPPLMLKTSRYRRPADRRVRSDRAGVVADRSQFFMDLSLPFRLQPAGARFQTVCASNSAARADAGMPACYFCIKAFSGNDQTEELKKLDVPTLIMPETTIRSTHRRLRMLSAKLVRGATLKVYRGDRTACAR